MLTLCALIIIIIEIGYYVDKDVYDLFQYLCTIDCIDASPWMPVLMVSGGHLMQQEQSMTRVDTLIMPAVTPT